MNGKRSFCTLAQVLFLWLALSGAASAQEPTFNGKPFEFLEDEDLASLELRADEARNQFHQGKFDGAVEVFEELILRNTASSALYMRELAALYLARQDYARARHLLIDSIVYADSMTDAKVEEQAISKFGKEAVRLYIGDPYETATAYLLLALLFLNEGDADNALAACKSGLLADSDASENLFQSDFTLLYLLEARCYDLRNQPQEARRSRQQATESYANSHPSVRSLFTERLDRLEQLKMTDRERQKLARKIRDESPGTPVFETEAALRSEIDRLSTRIRQVAESLNAAEALGPLFTGDFNALVLRPRGSVPIKKQHGKMLEAVYFKESPVILDGAPVFVGDERKILGWVNSVADLTFQATTRGGRRMDAILRGKASYKATTLSVSYSLMEAGAQAGGSGGAVLQLIGSIVAGVGSSMRPDADTRCWVSLPAEWDVLPLQLEPGTHPVRLENQVYYANQQASNFSLQTGAASQVGVVILPPERGAVYSDALFDISDSKKRRPLRVKGNGDNLLLVTPILQMGRTETIRSRQADKESPVILCEPEIIAKGLARQIPKETSYEAHYVPHPDALQRSLQDQFPQGQALQIYFDHASVFHDAKGKDDQYSLTLRIELVNIGSGEVIREETLTRQMMRPEKDERPPADILRSLLEESALAFLQTGA